jgi:hypothetical protein
MTSSCVPYRVGLALWLCAGAGCPATPPPDPPGLDCGAIDRPEERFPEECADAGEGEEETDAAE